MSERPNRKVSPVRAGMGAAVLAAVLVGVVFLFAPVPGFALALVGGEGDGVGRYGGVVLTWVPPAGLDAAAIATEITGSRVVGDAVELSLPGVPPEQADRAVELIAGGGVKFHRVIETEAMFRLIQDHGVPMPRDPNFGSEEVGVYVDHWSGEDGTSVTDYYLYGPSVAAIEAVVEEARRGGWHLPDGLELVYERVEELSDEKALAPFFRSYVLEAKAALDGRYIARADASFDPYTNRPNVSLQFTREGAELFAELTADVVNHKLAIVLAGEVTSAPVIQSAIRGGRASITMAGSDAVRQEQEVTALVAVLRGGVLPEGGTVRDKRIVGPTEGGTTTWAARGVLAFGAGLIVGLFAWLLVRLTAPVTRSRSSLPGRVPWRRIAVTLLAPLVVVISTSFATMPGLDIGSMMDLAGTDEAVSLAMFGITPLISAFLLVELVATLVPRWRVRRHQGSVARIPFDIATVAIALVVTGVQAFFTARYMDLAGAPPKSLLLFITSACAMTTVYVALAALIRAHGLGNGYLVVIASSVLWRLVALLVFGPSVPWGPELVMGEVITALVAMLVFAIAAGVILRWRIASAGEPALQLPTSGVASLNDVQSVLALVMVGAGSALAGTVAGGIMDIQVWAADLPRVIEIVLVIGIVVVLSWAFARPAVLEGYAERAGLALPSWASWRSATILSAGVFAALGGAHLLIVGVQPFSMVGAQSALILGALALDVAADLRSRRGTLVRVWALGSAQHIDLAETVLAREGIPYHLTGRYGRTLLAWFGPFVPVDVHVTAEQAERAHERLAMVFAPKV